MPTLELPSALRTHSGGKSRVTVDAHTVGDALRAVPALKNVLFLEDGTLKRTVGVFLDDDDVRAELDRKLKPDDVIVLIAAMAGG